MFNSRTAKESIGFSAFAQPLTDAEAAIRKALRTLSVRVFATWRLCVRLRNARVKSDAHAETGRLHRSRSSLFFVSRQDPKGAKKTAVVSHIRFYVPSTSPG